MIGGFFLPGHAQRVVGMMILIVIASGQYPVSAAEFQVTSTEDAVDIQPGDQICASGNGICSLRAAIQESNATPGQDTVLILPGTYLLQRANAREDHAAEGDLDLRDDTVIIGNTVQDTVIDAGQIDRVFDIFKVADQPVQVRISGVTIRGGRITYAGGDGGCIFNEGDLTLQDVTLTDCRSTSVDGAGGAIFNAGKRLTLTNATLSDSYASIGGAIASTGILDASKTVFRQNTAIQGGGVFLQAGELYFDDVDVDQNTSNRHGAGIHLGDHREGSTPVSATVINSRITSNVMEASQVAGQTSPQGGGIFVVAQSNLYIENSVIRGNRGADQCFVCEVSGGGLYNENGVVVLNNVSVTENRAALWGGGIYNFIDGTLMIVGSTISANQAGVFGGGIASEFHTANHDMAIISHSVLADNQAGAGGALAGSFSLTNVTVAGNVAGGTTHPVTQQRVYGGALFIPGANYAAHLHHVTFAGNMASANGSEIDNSHSGNVTVDASIVGIPGTAVTLCAGTINSAGKNIFSDDSCGAITDQGDAIADAMLGSLQDNGGSTLTRLPAQNSPIIDAITTACPTLDQRYFFRGTGPCDIGAVETNAARAVSGRIVFPATDLNWVESSSEYQITVERIDGGEGEISVDFVVRPDTARDGTDFTTAALSGTLHWANGDVTPKPLTILLVADGFNENEETFTIELRNATNAPISDSGRIATIHIFDALPEESNGGEISRWLLAMLLGAAVFRRAQRRRIL